MVEGGNGRVIAGYHGDAGREHKFWVYPQNLPLVTPAWDTHTDAKTFCRRAVFISNHGNGVAEWKCPGHKKDPHAPKKDKSHKADKPKKDKSHKADKPKKDKSHKEGKHSSSSSSSSSSDSD